MTKLIAADGVDELAAAMEESLGGVYPARAIGRYGASLNEKRKAHKLYSTAAGISTIASPAAKAVPNHSFYGRA